MNAAETIQAAIDKLEALTVQPVVYVKFSAEPASEEAAWFARAEEKLAIFNRTIDAQLAILRDGLGVAKSIASLGFGWSVLGRAKPAFDLARAILGEDA